MASRTLEKLADKIIKLTPEEGEQLALIIRAKIMPEQARQQQQGLLQQQQAMNPQMAQMGQRPGGNMPMPNARMAAQQGLLR
jgi:hypothetical protein|tara:strand:+ start:504 stop:749 length:246 start_codon:yes stop_codon:yes gene_type:complete